MGGNGQPFVEFNKKITVSILGDADADFPPEAIGFTNGVATINITFSRATAANEKFTIKIQTEDRTLRVEKQVTVQPAMATAQYSWDFSPWETCENNNQSRAVACVDNN